MCVKINDYEICDLNLYSLFAGDELVMTDGQRLLAHFADDHSHSNLCRDDPEGNEYCLDEILDLYEPPHDCLKIDG